MSESKSIPVVASPSGAFSIDIRLYGFVEAIGLRLGTLSTPDIDVTDVLTNTSLLSVNGVAADTTWQPRTLLQGSDGNNLVATYGPYAVTGILRVAVSGAGVSTEGAIIVLYQNRN